MNPPTKNYKPRCSRRTPGKTVLCWFLRFVCNVSCHVLELSVIVFLFVTFGLLEILGMTLFELLIEIIYWVGRAWRYQRDNQKPYIEEEQTAQWPKEKEQKDKQRSTKYTYKTNDRITRIPLKTGGELRWSGRIGSSWSTSGTRRVNLVTNPVISREWGNDRKCLRQVEHIHGHFDTYISKRSTKSWWRPYHFHDFNFTKRNPCFSSFLVSNIPLSRKSYRCHVLIVVLFVTNMLVTWELE